MEGLKQIAKASASTAKDVASAKKFSPKGLFSPPVTVFNSKGEVDLDSVGPYVQHMVEFGIPNAFVTGTTGEAHHMSVPERKALAERWIQEGRGKLSTIIIQVGTGNLVESQELARHAVTIGADAIACVGPTYFKPENFDCYLKYMAAVASEAPTLPFILYDIDFITGITFNTSEFFTRGKELIPTLAGVKHTSPDMVSINNVHNIHPDMVLMLGSDELYLPGLSVGVVGDIVSTYMGKTLNRMRAAYERGDMKAAQLEQSRALQVGVIRRGLGLSIPGGTKAVLRTMGMDMGSPRLPLAEVTPEKVVQLKQELTKIGFYEWAYAN